MRAAILRTVPEKTGRPVTEWVELVRASGIEKHRARIEFLKSHGVGHSTASVLVQVADGDTFEDPPEEEAVARQYRAGRAALRPIYEALRTAAIALGDDVQVDPRKDYVAFSRGRQFAVVRPSTVARVDLGLRLSAVAPGGRLILAKNLGSGMIDRCVHLAVPADVDAEVLAWLAGAYSAAA